MSKANAKRQTFIPMEQKNMRSLVTPEGVDLQLRLADTGARVAAFMVDLIIMILLMIGLSISLLMVAARIGGDSKDLVFVVWILGFFVIRNFYFMIFEMGPKAATPGKRLQKIRVASRNGGPLTASAVFARNAMRELEFFLPLGLLFGGGSGVDAWMHLLALVWSVIFLFFPLFNKDHLRMGDIIAGTIVVKSPKPKLSKDLSIETASDHQYIFSPAQINAYGVKELHVLENVLRNNHAKTLEQVSERIMKKIEWPDRQSYIDDPKAQREFLNAYYKALRAKLESGLLFGVRRKDKFDKTDV